MRSGVQDLFPRRLRLLLLGLGRRLHGLELGRRLLERHLDLGLGGLSDVPRAEHEAHGHERAEEGGADHDGCAHPLLLGLVDRLRLVEVLEHRTTPVLRPRRAAPWLI